MGGEGVAGQAAHLEVVIPGVILHRGATVTVAGRLQLGHGPPALLMALPQDLPVLACAVGWYVTCAMPAVQPAALGVPKQHILSEVTCMCSSTHRP